MGAYSKSLGNKICERIARSSLGLRHICREAGVSYSSVTRWIYDRQHELSANYAIAKQLQLQRIAENILAIVDDTGKTSIDRIKANISTQMQILSNLKPNNI